eukprot:11099849-Alexandrium_andersonii.AAC.1
MSVPRHHRPPMPSLHALTSTLSSPWHKRLKQAEWLPRWRRRQGTFRATGAGINSACSEAPTRASGEERSGRQ